MAKSNSATLESPQTTQPVRADPVIRPPANGFVTYWERKSEGSEDLVKRVAVIVDECIPQPGSYYLLVATRQGFSAKPNPVRPAAEPTANRWTIPAGG